MDSKITKTKTRKKSHIITKCLHYIDNTSSRVVDPQNQMLVVAWEVTCILKNLMALETSFMLLLREMAKRFVIKRVKAMVLCRHCL